MIIRFGSTHLKTWYEAIDVREQLTIPRPEGFTSRLLAYVDKQTVGMCFTGKGWSKDCELLAGFGVSHRFSGIDIKDAPSHFDRVKDYVFCHLNYEVKDQLENLHSRRPATCTFPLFELFIPQLVVKVEASKVHFLYHSNDLGRGAVESVIEKLYATQPEDFKISSGGESFHHIGVGDYLNDLRQLQQHIQRGDVYQANYCQEFFWEDVELNAPALFEAGTHRMANPFSVFYRHGNHVLMSFSPERFLRFDGQTVLSQPMKGTSPRDPDPVIDERSKDLLRISEKDRRENVMIVDLVRNDLSHFATPGSVSVPELYRIETYPRVHQMFSTVTAELKEGTHPLAVLLKAFPMGSMTGAPKVRAMQILESLERSQRGIYSGTVGFITPEGNGDFNVIIRSLVHDASTGVLSCHAGGGITDLSDHEAEYEESLVKVRPLLELVDDHCTTQPSTLHLRRATATS